MKAEKATTYRVEVLRDGKILKTFENQQNDFEAFKYILRNQSQSTDWAIKYEGWDVKVINEQNPLEFYTWKENSKK